MEIFNRAWELNISSNPNTQSFFEYIIKPDDFGDSLRISFDINASLKSIRFYQGTIKIYNLDPDKRKNLVFNILGEGYGTGPKIKLQAGYEGSIGAIMDGVVIRGYSVKEPTTGDFVTVLQCGTSFAPSQEITIQPTKVTNSTLFAAVKNWLSVLVKEGGIVDEFNRFIIKRTDLFDAKLINALDVYSTSNIINKTIGFTGTSAKILDEIASMFGLVFFYDGNGFNVTTNILIRDPPSVFDEVISEDTGMLGSPLYTDTGAKVKTYLRADYRLLQRVNIKSDVLDKVVKITSMNLVGDTYTNDWYNDIDTSHLGELIV